MKITRSILFVSIFATALFLLVGCISMNSKSFVPTQYGLKVTPPSQPHGKKFAKILNVYYPEVAAEFAGSSFVYRTSDINYTTDYYNVFFGTPAEQIHQNILRYLQGAKQFKYVADNVYPVRPDYALRTRVIDLYADYRDQNKPRAVLTVQSVLFDVSGEPKIIMNKTLQQNIPLRAKTSAALIQGWNVGLNSLLQKLMFNMEVSINQAQKITDKKT